MSKHTGVGWRVWHQLSTRLSYTLYINDFANLFLVLSIDNVDDQDQREEYIKVKKVAKIRNRYN